MSPRNGLRVPQARVLRALMPADQDIDFPIDWPLLRRDVLAIQAGYTGTSGGITRIMNGIREGNTTSGKPHLGLLALGLVEKIVLEVADGMWETNYRITEAGIAAYQAHVAIHGEELQPVKDAALCVNNRYRE